MQILLNANNKLNTLIIVEPVTCTNPPVVSFATKSSQTGSTYLDKITYTCDKGYERTGGYLVRTCKEDKTWDGSPPVCCKYSLTAFTCVECLTAIVFNNSRSLPVIRLIWY